jgi:rhodanese-related sulfurtransferase
MNMEKITIIVLALIIIVGGWFFISKKSTNTKNIGTGVLEVIGVKDFDFGEILMTGGLVKHNFTVKNTGNGPVSIKNAETSCACTTANIFDAKGDKNGPFGMVGPSHKPNPKVDIKILPGEEVTVEAIYDPLAHGLDATGKLVREIFINTDTKQELSMKFRGEGVKKFSEAKGPSLKFNNKEHDFGIVKQSQGTVETEFNVVNNGTETVVVDSLPASCECTEATIDKKEIAPGDKAKIKVVFDANLHPEPDGRFFKTIEIVSNIKPSPELKIYVNMDYDLGIDKLKIQEHNEVDNHTEEADGHSGAGFKSISSEDLSGMLSNKDFILIDVHTPPQQHIPGTDYMISYDEIDKIVSVIPSKSSKVVLYCRSGNMSKIASKKLAEMGYKNISELENGMNEWQTEKRKTMPRGSIKSI